MGELPFPDRVPPVVFADAWHSTNRHLPELHPLIRAALALAILALQISLFELFDYHPSAVQAQQRAMTMVELQANRPVTRPKELALEFVRANVPQIAQPQFTVMPNTDPAPKSTLPVTMALASPLAGGMPQGVGSGAGGASSCVDTAYLAEISRHIQQYFFYPADTNGTHLQGVVYVHFTSNSVGSYQSLNVAKSSGYPTLDQAALLIMQRASPLPMIPDRLHADLVNGVLPIVFELRGNDLKLTWKESGNC